MKFARLSLQTLFGLMFVAIFAFWAVPEMTKADCTICLYPSAFNSDILSHAQVGTDPGQNTFLQIPWDFGFTGMRFRATPRSGSALPTNAPYNYSGNGVQLLCVDNTGLVVVAPCQGVVPTSAPSTPIPCPTAGSGIVITGSTLPNCAIAATPFPVPCPVASTGIVVSGPTCIISLGTPGPTPTPAPPTAPVFIDSCGNPISGNHAINVGAGTFACSISAPTNGDLVIAFIANTTGTPTGLNITDSNLRILTKEDGPIGAIVNGHGSIYLFDYGLGGATGFPTGTYTCTTTVVGDCGYMGVVHFSSVNPQPAARADSDSAAGNNGVNLADTLGQLIVCHALGNNNGNAQTNVTGFSQPYRQDAITGLGGFSQSAVSYGIATSTSPTNCQAGGGAGRTYSTIILSYPHL